MTATAYSYAPKSCYVLLNQGTPDCSILAYGDSNPNSTGQPAWIGWTGSASIQANDLVLTARDLPPSVQGLFFFGTAKIDPGVPFGNGLRLVGGAVKRLPVVSADGSGMASYALDFTLPPLDALTSADVRYFQFWYRDPTEEERSSIRRTHWRSISVNEVISDRARASRAASSISSAASSCRCTRPTCPARNWRTRGNGCGIWSAAAPAGVEGERRPRWRSSTRSRPAARAPPCVSDSRVNRARRERMLAARRRAKGACRARARGPRRRCDSRRPDIPPRARSRSSSVSLRRSAAGRRGAPRARAPRARPRARRCAPRPELACGERARRAARPRRASARPDALLGSAAGSRARRARARRVGPYAAPEQQRPGCARQARRREIRGVDTVLDDRDEERGWRAQALGVLREHTT